MYPAFLMTSSPALFGLEGQTKALDFSASRHGAVSRSTLGSRSNGYSCSLTACWIAQASPLLLFLTRTRGRRAPSATARAAACACTLPPLVLRSPTNFAVSVVVQEVASREHTLTNKITPNFAIYLLLLIKVRD